MPHMESKKPFQYIDSELMARVADEARLSPRLRMNYNFHSSTNEPVNRLINVMHRGSYLPVHRHLSPDRCESSVIVRGRIGILFYDDEGNITSKREVGPACDCVGFDIEPGVWHGLVVLEDDTVVFEIKQGPYAPITPENLAPWSPAATDTEAVEQYIKALEAEFK